jgi:hypothetical protein
LFKTTGACGQRSCLGWMIRSVGVGLLAWKAFISIRIKDLLPRSEIKKLGGSGEKRSVAAAWQMHMIQKMRRTASF